MLPENSFPSVLQSIILSKSKLFIEYKIWLDFIPQSIFASHFITVALLKHAKSLYSKT
jgi:hypothetical protein